MTRSQDDVQRQLLERSLLSRLSRDGATVAAGQFAAAIGTLVGIRLLTEIAAPSTFGMVSLALGIAALGLNTASTPFTQAALHLYPQLESDGRLIDLRNALAHTYWRAGRVVGLVVAVGSAVLVTSDQVSWVLCALVTLLLAVDIMRSVSITFLNAARRHARFSAWLAAEATIRPIAGVWAVIQFGDSAETLLAAYLVSSVLLLWAFSNSSRAHLGIPPSTLPSTEALQGRIWKYALPLIPLGAIGWINGLGDRYLIGGMLGVAEAGIYAAAYGLVSRPFLMLGQTVELTIRPIYQAQVALEPSSDAAKRLLAAWVIVVMSVGSLGAATIAFWSDELSSLLLGREYRSGAALMPWIAFGYVLLVTSYAFERVCLAHGRSGWIPLIQGSAGAVGLVATVVGILGWGLKGAAVAVPVYFGAQLLLSMFAAKRAYKDSVGLAGVVGRA